MSTKYMLHHRDGPIIGIQFGTPEGVRFGFVPVDEYENDPNVLPPGTEGFGRAMLQYWLAQLEPDTVIVDVYGAETKWGDFSREIDESGILSDHVFRHVRDSDTGAIKLQAI